MCKENSVVTFLYVAAAVICDAICQDEDKCRDKSVTYPAVDVESGHTFIACEMGSPLQM